MKNVTKRKSQYRIRELLPNGQYLNLYFKRKKGHTTGFFQWHVGMYISENRKESNRWYSKKYKGKKSTIVGDGTIVALRHALHAILEFKDQLGFNEELLIGWEDERRMNAYRWLKRYGFIDYTEDGKVSAYGIRNPEYWEFIPNK